MAKTLIFGGAFDPPHEEHVHICKAALAELGADRLVIVPTYQPPHKSAGYLSFDERCSLIRKAFSGVDFVIDDIEYQRGTDNCAYKVLPLLKEKYGDIVYLIGGDSVRHFDT
ncbi:MAG: nicotinate-nicotinamide nucleotide adenylyltransferase, partial [Clostridia bacterium]|nr:nicotinate-nicotinamide nucleotide adenylyltransferase [Clostridia bacterium]